MFQYIYKVLIFRSNVIEWWKSWRNINSIFDMGLYILFESCLRNYQIRGMLFYNTNRSSIFVFTSDFMFIVFYFLCSCFSGIQIATFGHVRVRDVNISWIGFDTKQFFSGSPAFLSFSPMWSMNIQVIFDYFFVSAQGVYRSNTKAI